MRHDWGECKDNTVGGCQWSVIGGRLWAPITDHRQLITNWTRGGQFLLHACKIGPGSEISILEQPASRKARAVSRSRMSAWI